MDYIAITALTYYYYSKDKDLIITLEIGRAHV